MAIADETEESFTRAVLQLAALFGWRRIHLRPAVNRRGNWSTPVQGDGEGFPDLLLLRRGRLIVAELKVPGNNTTPEQEAWLAAFREAQAGVYTWRPADWKLIEEILA
jgi:hypothetical protein